MHALNFGIAVETPMTGHSQQTSVFIHSTFDFSCCRLAESGIPCYKQLDTAHEREQRRSSDTYQHLVIIFALARQSDWWSPAPGDQAKTTMWSDVP